MGKAPCGVVAVHGGCGIIGKMTADREAKCREGLCLSAEAAMKVIRANGTATDAVVAAIKVMEDDPLFNAGKGAVFTSVGTNELDAGLMDGCSGAVGGVSTLKKVKNPIVAAELVMHHTKHSLLCGDAADNFALEHGCEAATSDYFFTETRFNQLKTVLKNGSVAQLDHNVSLSSEGVQGTVGAVALDRFGHLAAGSSTGGMSGKLPGRVSDSSIAGAGFYADGRVALSGTGNGDEFIRISASKQIADMMKYRDMSLLDASNHVVHVDMKNVHAGFVGVDCDGTVAMPFNTPGMFRATLHETDSAPQVYIFI